MDEIDAVTTPRFDRANDSHPVMHNPRNEARAAYFRKYHEHAPKGWPYTETEVREANQLTGMEEGDDDMGPMKAKIAMKRLG